MKDVKKKSGHISPLVIVLFSILLLYVISFLIPLFWGFITSLKSFRDYGNPNFNIVGFPNSKWSADEMFRFENYRYVLENFEFVKEVTFYSNGKLITHSAQLDFGSLLLYTILYAIVGGMIMSLVPAVVAYVCAKYDFWYSKIVYTTALVVLSIPSIGIYPAELALLRNLGIYDTFIGTWIQKFAFTGLYFFVYYSFFKGLSDTYVEAAEIDGASQLKVMVSIIFPLAIKIISTVFLIQFISLWNDYQTANLYLPTHPTLAYGMYNLSYATNIKGVLQKPPGQFAGYMLLALPMLIIFVIFRNRIMGDVSMGGIKE